MVVPSVTWLAFLCYKVDQSSYFQFGYILIPFYKALYRNLKKQKQGDRMEVFGCYSPSLCGILKQTTSAWYGYLQTLVIPVYACAMWNKLVLAWRWVSQEGPAKPAGIADTYGVGGVGEGFIWNSFLSLPYIFKIWGVGQNYFFFS